MNSHALLADSFVFVHILLPNYLQTLLAPRVICFVPDRFAGEANPSLSVLKEMFFATFCTTI
jgi:hypothetical protein